MAGICLSPAHDLQSQGSRPCSQKSHRSYGFLGAVSARSASRPLIHSIMRALAGDSVLSLQPQGEVRVWEEGRSVKLRCVCECACVCVQERCWRSILGAQRPHAVFSGCPILGPDVHVQRISGRFPQCLCDWPHRVHTMCEGNCPAPAQHDEDEFESHDSYRDLDPSPRTSWLFPLQRQKLVGFSYLRVKAYLNSCLAVGRGGE